MFKIIQNKFFYFILCWVLTAFVPITDKSKQEPVIYNVDTRWVDSLMNVLTPDERIAQLFMVAAYSNKDEAHKQAILKLVSEYKIGGLIFMQGGPVRQAQLCNLYQSKSKVPLMIAIDGEWGLAMRLDSTIKYPRQMTLGAIQNDTLIYLMGAEIARQCRRLGIHVNFAPVVDVNNNPLNPVISNRSFGEDKELVTKKASAYMRGMQDNRVLANAKHFPGHGDTDSDSHKTLPIINHPFSRIDTLELYPFKQLFNQGLGSIMVAHLYIPALDTTTNLASTLSPKVVNGLLKDSLGFKGLIFTDALNMKGVSKFYKPGYVDVKAILAGNDVLLFSEDVPTAMTEIKKAIANGEITQEQIDERCRKILMAKKWLGLDNYKPIKIENLYNDLNNTHAELINRKLSEAAITLLKNEKNLIPLMRLDTLRVATLTIGYKEPNKFQSTIDLYMASDHYFLHRDAQRVEVDTMLSKLSAYNLLIVNINNTNNSPTKDFGLSAHVNYVLQKLDSSADVIVNIAANPYILAKIPELKKCEAVIMSYEDNEYTQTYAAQAIFGGISISGKLPINATEDFKLGTGITIQKIRFKYTIPEDIGISSKYLSEIDSIALLGIRERAYPGCQVLVAKDGNVIYQKSFGYHTYENKRKVNNSDIFDLASITKIAGALPAIMKLVDEKKINIDDPLVYYMPQVKGSNKQYMCLREILAHQAGLKDWIPFYLATLKQGQYKEGIYDTKASDEFPYRVAEKLYIHKSYKDTIYKKIIESPINPKFDYKYSDLGYYFFHHIIEDITKEKLDEYVYKNFYLPLGMTTTGYNPRNRFDLRQIVPTEYDMAFRKQLVHGDVHDQGAAMLGGVAGHAGLFSCANDLAKLMQMYLQYGEYGGKQYISREVVDEFIRCQFCENNNRRGAGFDKPEPDSSKDGPTCKCVSYMSFGHSGFTGTYAWADPEYGIVYIFLSNRVYPDAENKKLIKMGIRTRIQQVIYDAVNAQAKTIW
ncbi:MAG: glycoside hydrolase family 3 N-terminal domain-containing protein [Bacteroidia bacterium]